MYFASRFLLSAALVGEARNFDAVRPDWMGGRMCHVSSTEILQFQLYKPYYISIKKYKASSLAFSLALR